MQQVWMYLKHNYKIVSNQNFVRVCFKLKNINLHVEPHQPPRRTHENGRWKMYLIVSKVKFDVFLVLQFFDIAIFVGQVK